MVAFKAFAIVLLSITWVLSFTSIYYAAGILPIVFERSYFAVREYNAAALLVVITIELLSSCGAVSPSSDLVK